MQLTIKTHAQTEMIDITHKVQQFIESQPIKGGICMIYVPHTTAAVTINESADPNVREDIVMVLNQMVPWKAPYRHMEGNSPAHVKASLIGLSRWRTAVWCWEPGKGSSFVNSMGRAPAKPTSCFLGEHIQRHSTN